MSGTAVIQAGCCCGGGQPCFAHYIGCNSGFDHLSIRYPNGCPQVHPQVIGWASGDPNHSCYYFDQVVPSGIGVIITPAQIVATFNTCEECHPTTTPLGGCCLPDGSCVTTTQASCAVAGGTYQGDNTSCSPNPCLQPPLGACCYDDGSPCQDLTQAQCQAGGGNWQGAGTTCQFVHCPPPTGGNTGACCVPQAGGFGLCQDNLTEQQCLNSQGLYLGDGTTCGFIECPPPPYFAARQAAPAQPSRGLGDTLVKVLRFVGVRI